jgi:hypothetical protein
METLDKLKNDISESVTKFQYQYPDKTPKRVKLGLREQEILNAPPSTIIRNVDRAYKIDPQTGTQSIMGLEIVQVKSPSCIAIEE